MDIRSILDSLSVNDKKILLAVQKAGGEAHISAIENQLSLDHVAVMRSALTLEKIGLIKIAEVKKTLASLTEEGESYAREGLPERRMLHALYSFGQCAIEELSRASHVPREKAQISLGWLRRKGWAEIIKEEEKTKIKITPHGEEALNSKFADELLLEGLSSGPKIEDELPADQRRELQVLERRGLVKLDEKIERKLSLTELGHKAIELGVELVEEVGQLTRELIVSGRWRNVKLKRYDVTAPVAPVFPGKVHPQQEVIDELREILLEMGFLEIKGHLVESEFWNFDALFQAQNHPAREIHDSLSLSKPSATKLPDLGLALMVAAAHERGVAGSRGWRYKFNLEVSRRPVLRSQTTAATIRFLATRPKPPVKVFCIDRVYRHERIDYKHLAEFYQCEGIVMNKGLTLRDMLGYLKQILVRLGFEKIRFRPGYFPFTEPSVEADVYQGGRGEWLEILGAGMFRPEVLRPLGIRYPVLAWGIGLSRLMMLRLKLEDIRDLFKNDLEWLRAGRGV
jgi:phenylalanyl-tRNA synthetase alpha chain